MCRRGEAQAPPALGEIRPDYTCVFPPHVTVKNACLIGPTPLLDRGTPLPRLPGRPPLKLRRAQTLAACKFTLEASGVRIAGQHTKGRVQKIKEMQRVGAEQLATVFSLSLEGHLPHPAPTTGLCGLRPDFRR